MEDAENFSVEYNNNELNLFYQKKERPDGGYEAGMLMVLSRTAALQLLKFLQEEVKPDAPPSL